jgi:hypothetical protein
MIWTIYDELDLCSGRPQLLYNAVQAVLIDGPQSFRRDLQRDPLVFFGQKKALGLQIRQEPPLGLDIRVGNAISGDRRLSRNLTNSSHDNRKFGRQRSLNLFNYQKEKAVFGA